MTYSSQTYELIIPKKIETTKQAFFAKWQFKKDGRSDKYSTVSK